MLTWEQLVGLTVRLRTLNQTASTYTRPGYDDVTGVESPNGVSFLNAMAHGGGNRH